MSIENSLYIQARGLGKSYNIPREWKGLADAFSWQGRISKKIALEGVDLDIREGERVGIIGENGAGKSTLLKLIAGTTSPSTGELDINGRVHAVLTLGLGLREEASGRENFYLDAEVHGKQRSEIEPYIEEMVAFSDLGEFIDKPVKTYSSGMKSRLTFTSLIFVDPEILLLDETLSTGDQWFQKKATIAMQELCARGKIVLIVSHGMSAILNMCNRCIWIKDGQIHADGPPVQVTSAYSEYQLRRVDNELASSFAREETDWFKTKGVKIRNIDLVSASRPAGGRVLFTDEEGQARIVLDLKEKLGNPALRLRLERVDGLCVFEQVMPRKTWEKVGTGVQTIAIDFGDFPVGAGLYKIEVELTDRGQMLAKRSAIFKVHCDMPFIGGRPVLHYPIQAEGTPARP